MGTSVERNAQLERVLQIIRDLDRVGGIDLYELAEIHGTTVRTIRRDLDALQAAGLPITQEADGRRKRWRIAHRDHLTKLAELVDVSHYLALRVALGGAGARSTTLYASLEDLADKVAEALGKKARRQLEIIERAFYSYEKFAFREAPADVLWPLVDAIAERRLCRVIYRAVRLRPVDKTFEVLPLRLFAYNGALYLHAWVPKHDSVILLHLHRVRRLRVLMKRASPPKTFRAEDWEASAFGVYSGGPLVDYRLRFQPIVAPHIRERTWHGSQKLRELDGGGVELTFRCSDSPELVGWIASWHSNVEVVAPASLRQQLRRVGAWYADVYSGRPAIRAVPVRADRAKPVKRRSRAAET
jgi:predicted DNA-binding transcriptional regulator YafY